MNSRNKKQEKHHLLQIEEPASSLSQWVGAGYQYISKKLGSFSAAFTKQGRVFH